MSNHNKDHLKARDSAQERKKTDKLGLLIEFVIFMAVVLVIGIYSILSLTTCQQNNKQAADKIQNNKDNK